MTWIRVNQQVSADVQFLSASCVPRLQSIEWNGAEHRFVGPARVRCDATGILFTVRDDEARYAVQLDPAQQEWKLIAIDDPWLMGPHERPRPRSFLPPRSDVMPLVTAKQGAEIG